MPLRAEPARDAADGVAGHDEIAVLIQGGCDECTEEAREDCRASSVIGLEKDGAGIILEGPGEHESAPIGVVSSRAADGNHDGLRYWRSHPSRAMRRCKGALTSYTTRFTLDPVTGRVRWRVVPPGSSPTAPCASTMTP